MCTKLFTVIVKVVGLMSDQSLRQNALDDRNRFGGSVLGRLCPHIFLLLFLSCCCNVLSSWKFLYCSERLSCYESSRAVGTPKTLQEFGVKGSYVRAESKTRVCRQGVSRDVNASKEGRRVVVMGTLSTKVLAKGG